MIFARILIVFIALVVPTFTYLAKVAPQPQTIETEKRYISIEENPNLPAYKRYTPLIKDTIIWFGFFTILYRATKRIQKGGIVFSILLLLLFAFLIAKYFDYAVEESSHLHDEADKSGFLYWLG